jgi:hypothetical protein
MAKPLGAKSRLIREAIHKNPNKGNTELAEMLSASADRAADKLTITAQDVAAQRQALKNLGVTTPAPAPSPAASNPAGNGRKKRGRKPGKKPGPTLAASAPAAHPEPVVAAPRPTTDVVSHVEAIREAVRKLGADQVKRIVGLFE